MSQSQGPPKMVSGKSGGNFWDVRNCRIFWDFVGRGRLDPYTIFVPRFLHLDLVVCDFSLCTVVNHHHFGEDFLGSLVPSIHTCNSKIYTNRSPLITPWLCPPCFPRRHLARRFRVSINVPNHWRCESKRVVVSSAHKSGEVLGKK